MTAQISERLLYQGEMVSMCSEPLNSYFEKAGIRPPFARNCTALYRGYVGLWEIFENRLYLNQLKGNPINGTELSVKSIFPSAGDKVFADWFTGTIRVPQGKMIEYLHHGYGSTFERDLFLEIEKDQC